MRDWSGMTMCRFVRVKGQIGLSSNERMLGWMMGPPADKEYAVEPVGVEMMRPSARYDVMYWSSTRTSRLTILAGPPLLMTISFNTW